MKNPKDDPAVAEICPPGHDYRFRSGILLTESGKPDGIRKVVECESSNGLTMYTAVLWGSGVASCNCPGWVHDRDGRRYCRHVQTLAASETSVAHPRRTEMRSAVPEELKAAAEETLRGIHFDAELD